MEWKDVGNIIGKSAPLIGGLFGPLGGAIGNIVASVFGVQNDPASIYKAIQNDPQAALKLVELETSHRETLIKLQLEHEISWISEQTKQLSEVNQTIRSELQSTDKFKSYWRPMFGYIVAFVWAFQALIIGICLIYCVVETPDKIGELGKGLTSLIGSLTIDWGIALSVLGINISKRSQDKQLDAGLIPESTLQKIGNLWKQT